jgi:hypothetical protein
MLLGILWVLPFSAAAYEWLRFGDGLSALSRVVLVVTIALSIWLLATSSA